MKFYKVLMACLLSISNLLWFQVIAEELDNPADSDSTASSSNVSWQNQLRMWPIDLINYSLSNSNIILTYLTDINLNYWYSMKDNLKSIYHNLMARILEILFPIKAAAIQFIQEYNVGSNMFNFLMYLFQWIQNILFRFDTIVVLCIFFAISFFMHRRNVIDIPALHPNPHNQHHHPYSLDRLLTKLFRCLNFTVVFSNLFTVVDSTIKSYFETQSIINQAHYGTAAAYSMQGRRPNMEDCFTLKNNISDELGIDYYAVFDGHGGPNAALYAEKEIFERVSKRIRNILGEQDSCSNTISVAKKSPVDSCAATNKNKFESLTLATMKNILNEEIINVDKTIVETYEKKSDISGTTALIAIRLVHSNKILVANVGDSRAIMCDFKGATIPMSFDHKPYQLKEYRRILEAGGYISLKGVYRVNGILAISRALGDYPLKTNRLIIPDPDILTFDLNEFDPRFMIMATDGFWDTFTNENAVQYVQNELSKIHKIEMADSLSLIALHVAKRLAKEAYARESYDNITVIFILFDEKTKKAVLARATTSSVGGNLSTQQPSTNKSSPDSNSKKQDNNS